MQIDKQSSEAIATLGYEACPDVCLNWWWFWAGPGLSPGKKRPEVPFGLPGLEPDCESFLMGPALCCLLSAA